MKLGLCMIVKDEARHIEPCLENIADLFDQIVVMDTGSTDATRDILAQRFGIRPVSARLDPDRCYDTSGIRNRGFSLLETPWIMTLDADERLSRAELAKITALEDVPSIAGYFTAWNTHKGEGAMVEDYKLSVFRKGLFLRGVMHENLQYEVRERGLDAVWLDGVSIEHFPVEERDGYKARFYRERLLCGLRSDPTWYRYHWFLGYMHFRQGRPDEAVSYLSVAADSRSLRFPVECLNSMLVLADIRARAGERAAVERTLTEAASFYERVADDFEVKVNFRLKPWIDRALAHCREGELERIRVYAFGH